MGRRAHPASAHGRHELGRVLNANIFHPDQLALTFSEHLFGQALQILPVYWITGNIILCYNLPFITTLPGHRY